MGILGKIKEILGRKKKTEITPIPEVEKEPLTPYTSPPEEETLSRIREPLPSKPPVPEPLPRPPELTPELRVETREANIENVRAKIDLLLTQVESIKTQNQTISERLRAIEKAIAEMKGIRYY